MATPKGAKALFIIPSVAGIILFMVPVKIGGKWTIFIKILSDAIGDAIGAFLPTLCCLIS